MVWPVEFNIEQMSSEGCLMNVFQLSSTPFSILTMATYFHIDYVFTTVFLKSSAIAEKMIGNDWWLFGDKIQRQVDIET